MGIKLRPSGYEPDELTLDNPGIKRFSSAYQGNTVCVVDICSRLFPPVYGCPASSVRHRSRFPRVPQATWTASVSLSGTSTGNDKMRCRSSAVATRARVSIRFFAPPPSSRREITD